MPVVQPTAAPVITPAGGTYQTNQSGVTIASTNGASIIYTLDGSAPNPATQTSYPSPVTISVPQSLTVRAVATASGFSLSAETDATFSIVRYGRNVPAARPTKRVIDIRSMSFGLSGPIRDYPVYQFANDRRFWERDRHNPFAEGNEPPYY
jgi:hypothetical protein